MTINELYKRIMQRQALMLEMHAELAKMMLEQGQDINAVSLLIEQNAPVDTAPPAEMAVHVPSTMELPPVRFCDKECSLVDNHDGPCLDAEDAAVVNPEEMRTPPSQAPASGTRRRTDYTAAEWAHSPHFLRYVSMTAPFRDWSAEEQNRKRDEFTAHHKDSPRQNRWGRTFAKFCGVT